MIDLAKVARSVVDTVALPSSGRVVELRWIDATCIDIAREFVAGDSSRVPDLLERILPDATADERSRLRLPEINYLICRAMGQDVLDEADLGESSGGEEGPPTPPSSQPT